MTLKEFKNKNSKINIVFIPGGPGLSSISFKELMPLRKKYSLYFFNPMGTTTKLKKIPSYYVLLKELKDSTKGLDNVVLCGHSFGGIQVIDIASDNPPNIKGVIAISAPVSKNAFSILFRSFKKESTEKHHNISEKMKIESSDETYKQWFYVHRDFYFNPQRSNDLISIIKDDSVCVKNYLGALNESSQKFDKLDKIKNIKIPKLFISGYLDKVVPPKSAKYEAEKGGFQLKIVQNAGHFIHYECPEDTIKIIDGFLTQF